MSKPDPGMNALGVLALELAGGDAELAALQASLRLLRRDADGRTTPVDGTVIEKIDQSEWGVPVVRVQTNMTTQTGDVILKGTAEVSLPV